MFSGCLTIDCLRSFCLVKSRGFAHLAALGLVSMMLHYVIVKTVVLVGLTGMHKTGCSERQDLSCTYLAHLYFWSRTSSSLRRDVSVNIAARTHESMIPEMRTHPF